MSVSQSRSRILEVRGLRKAYGATPALAGVDLDVAAGEIVGLLGPNGAGKTTLVSIVAGLRRADAGTVRVAGIDALGHPHRVRPLLGLAPQETGVYPTLTTRQNLRFFGELTGLRGRRLDDAIADVADSLQLTPLLDRRVQHLSGGERRRLHTALALVHRPALVMLDEPTTGADVRTRAQLLELVADVAAGGSAVVYSTHYLHEIEELAARVVVIDRGRVVAGGSVAALVEAHATSVVTMVFEDGDALHVDTHDPDTTIAGIMEALGPDVSRLRRLDVERPSLEAVYLELTGRRDAPADEAPARVA
jgi:ABC-2 type transport system ATP-binding protein